jgi:hypothetical protein
MSLTNRKQKTVSTEGLIEPKTTPDNCSHNYSRYSTRFGDWCCINCHAQMGWHPELVREGIYEEETNLWIAHQGLAKSECAEWDNKIIRIWKNK